MNQVLSHPACLRAYHQEGHICVDYDDGQSVRFPVSINRRLRDQTEDHLNHIEIGYFGLHWPQLDEDLSHAGLREGRFGQP